jgi:hypothetical protein
MQTVLVYGYVLDGIVTAIGEVGISGSRFYFTLLSPVRRSTRGGPETAAGFYWYCFKQFQFE